MSNEEISQKVEKSRATSKETKVSPARLAAFKVLERVEESSAHSDDLLYGSALAGLSQADKNLAMALVLGVLRWEIALDLRLESLYTRPDVPLAHSIRTALRLGAFQLLHLDRIPAHAALSESVELVRHAGYPHAAGMVNGVLRNLTRQPAARKPLVESAAAMASRLGHPEWLVERWVKNYGRAAAEAICSYDQQEPEEGTLFAPAEDLPKLDDGSRLVAELTAAAVENPRKIWDACAAPGGKTLILARRHPEADLLATDVSPKRLKAMQARLQKELPASLGASRIRTFQADAALIPGGEGDFDLILCDVPCSGTGTLARNPEIRHRLRPMDLGLQAKRQREILSTSLKRLAPGGRLVYSTCSLEPEENQAVVENVLRRQKGISRSDVTPLLTSLPLQADPELPARIVRDGYLRTLPGNGFQGDGFFAAIFERQA